MTIAEQLLERGAICRPSRQKRIRPKPVAGDKGYAFRKYRRYLCRRGIRSTIPRRKDDYATGSFDSALYRQRNRVERLFNRLKQFRRIATRYEKRASSYAAMLTVFIDSEIHLDPSLRESGQLPDSSIVPDLWIEANAAITMILNGRVLSEELVLPEGGLIAGDALLQKGINRLVLICSCGEEEIWVNAWLVTKFGEAVRGIGTRLMFD